MRQHRRLEAGRVRRRLRRRAHAPLLARRPPRRARCSSCSPTARDRRRASSARSTTGWSTRSASPARPTVGRADRRALRAPPAVALPRARRQEPARRHAPTPTSTSPSRARSSAASARPASAAPRSARRSCTSLSTTSSWPAHRARSRRRRSATRRRTCSTGRCLASASSSASRRVRSCSSATTTRCTARPATGRITRGQPARRASSATPSAALRHPTIVSGVRADDELAATETFGPLVGVAAFRDWDEAIALANGHGYGLSSAIYTRDPRPPSASASGIGAGMVSVNNSTSGAEAHLPFGGNGRSGNGSRQSGRLGARPVHPLAGAQLGPLRAGCRRRRWTSPTSTPTSASASTAERPPERPADARRRTRLASSVVPRPPLLAPVAAALAAAAAAGGCGGHAAGSGTAAGGAGDAHGAGAAPSPRAVPPRRSRCALVATRRLPAPVQLPALAVGGGEVLAAGGLDAADASVADVVRVAPGRRGASPRSRRRSTTRARPRSAGTLYVSGGGTAGRARPTRSRRSARRARRAPRAASRRRRSDLDGGDGRRRESSSSAATPATAPLRSILAFRPGRAPRGSRALPRPLRYAAVAAVGGRAARRGRDRRRARAQREVLRFDPAHRRARRIGRLPAAARARRRRGARRHVLRARRPRRRARARSGAISAIDPRTRPRARAPAGCPSRSRTSAPRPSAGASWSSGGRDAAGASTTSCWTSRRDEARARRAGRGRGARRLRRRAAARTPPRRQGPARPHDRRPRAPAGDRADACRPRARPHPRAARPPRRLRRRAAPGRLAPAVRARPARASTCPNSRVRHRRRDLPAHRPDRRPLRRRRAAAARHAVVGPAHAVGDQRHGQQRSRRSTRAPAATAGRVPVADPYNLYFTADGRRAIVVAEAHRELDFREPHTMRLRHALRVPQCAGRRPHGLHRRRPPRARLVRVRRAAWSSSTSRRERVRQDDRRCAPGAMPQDVKLSPDGRTFYVADMASNGVWLIDARTLAQAALPAHRRRRARPLPEPRLAAAVRLQPRRGLDLACSRSAPAARSRKWHIPGGGSPDMGGVSADGRVLWLTGRYNAEVYAISTRTGRLLHRIPVGAGPARAVRLAAARPLLDRPHRHPALGRRGPGGPAAARYQRGDVVGGGSRRARTCRSDGSSSATCRASASAKAAPSPATASASTRTRWAMPRSPGWRGPRRRAPPPLQAWSKRSIP